MSVTVSSYIPTAGASATRALDAISWAVTARPQEGTWYARFIELGSVLDAAGTYRIWEIGDGGNPRLRLNANGSNAYEASHHNGTSGVTATAAATPDIGSVVELLVQLADDGSVVLSQAIDGATEVTTAATAALTLAEKWNDTVLRIGGSNGTAGIGMNAHLNMIAVRGIHSMARMRQRAGIT